MNPNLLGTLAADLLAGFLGGFSAVGPVPELTFIIQMGGVGGLIGTVVALYRDRHEPDSDRRWRIVAA